MHDKKTVIITGGNGLIGRTLANHLCGTGYKVIVVDITPQSPDLDTLIDFIQFDLTNLSEFDRLMDMICEKTNNLYGLVNNAAFNPRVEDEKGFGDLNTLTIDIWRREFELNLTAPVFLIQALLPHFNRRLNEYCKIVNVISTYGIVAPNQGIYKSISQKSGASFMKPLTYSVSKAGLHMVTKYLSTHPDFKAINVNSIAPGGIQNGQDSQFIEDYSNLVPMGRMAIPEEMLGTFELLLSGGSNYIQGQIITVDGGWTVW